MVLSDPFFIVQLVGMFSRRAVCLNSEDHWFEPSKGAGTVEEAKMLAAY